MDSSSAPTIRERTRRIAQAELTVVAQDLFREFGYEDTTVDQIATAAGMSRRTFFRYFGSKEDLVIGKYDLFGDRVAEAFDDRPTDEPVWTSMRRVFDLALDYVQDEEQRERNDAMDRIVNSSPHLQARYLEKMQRVQDLLVGRVADRMSSTTDPDDPRPAALVGAAFACMQAARKSWLNTDQSQPFGDYLDQAMSAVQLA